MLLYLWAPYRIFSLAGILGKTAFNRASNHGEFSFSAKIDLGFAWFGIWKVLFLRFEANFASQKHFGNTSKKKKFITITCKALLFKCFRFIFWFWFLMGCVILTFQVKYSKEPDNPTKCMWIFSFFCTF